MMRDSQRPPAPRVLVINPNTDERVTAIIRATAAGSPGRAGAPSAAEPPPGTPSAAWPPPGTGLGIPAAARLEFATAPFGPDHVASRTDELVAAWAVVQTVVARRAEFDAFVVACFGDPGVAAAREVSGRPVVGMAQAAVAAALATGTRVGVLATMPDEVDAIRELVEAYGCAGTRLAGVFAAGVSTPELASAGAPPELASAGSPGGIGLAGSAPPPAGPPAPGAFAESPVRAPGAFAESPVRVPGHAAEALLRAGRAAVSAGADVVCLGCSAMSPHAAELRRELGVPVIDGVAAAISLAVLLAASGQPGGPRHGSKPYRGVPLPGAEMLYDIDQRP